MAYSAATEGHSAAPRLRGPQTPAPIPVFPALASILRGGSPTAFKASEERLRLTHKQPHTNTLRDALPTVMGKDGKLAVDRERARCSSVLTEAQLCNAGFQRQFGALSMHVPSDQLLEYNATSRMRDLGSPVLQMNCKASSSKIFNLQHLCGRQEGKN